MSEPLPAESAWPPTLGELPFGLTAPELRARSSALIEEAQRDLRGLVTLAEPPTVATFLVQLDRLLTRVQDVSAHGGLIFAVHPDAEVRAAGREASEAADRFFNEDPLDQAAYETLGRIDLAPEEETTRFAVAKMIRDMRRAGVEKDPRTRARLLTLSNSIDRVSNQFSENIAKLDREIEVDGVAALRGLPPDYLEVYPPGPVGGSASRLNIRSPDLRWWYCEDSGDAPPVAPGVHEPGVPGEPSRARRS